MSDLQKDFKAIEDYLNSPSLLGEFKRKDEPMYQVLKSDVEYTGRVLAKAEHVYNMRNIQHIVATAELKAFVDGESLDKNFIQNVKEKISDFEEELKKGVWN